MVIVGYVTPSTDLLAPEEQADVTFLTSKVAAAISLVALCCLQSIPPGAHLPHTDRALPHLAFSASET